MTGLEIAAGVLLALSLVGNGALGALALSKDNSDEVVREALAPYMAELDNVASLIDPARTPFCDADRDQFDAFRCVTVEVCATATGSDTEVTNDCQAAMNLIVTEEVSRIASEFADDYWKHYDGDDENEKWLEARKDFLTLWDKRKG